MNKKNFFDIIIVGSGLNGIIAAEAFAGLGLNICVIEKNEIKITDEDKDGRAFSISKGSSDLLVEIGLWKDLEKHACPIEFIRVLENGTEHVLDFDSSLLSEGEDKPKLGFIIEAKNLNNILRANLKNSKKIKVMEQVTVSDIEHKKDHVQLTLRDKTGEESTISANLALIADGKFSALRDRLGIETKTLCYGQTAMIFTIEHSLPHNNIAVENFTHTGPFAVLPIVGGYNSGIVWIEENDIATYIMQLKAEDRLELMKGKIGAYLGEVKIISEIISYPLILKYTNDYYRGRALLFGDSLHSIHPLAGQGLNLAMNDLKALLMLIKEHNSSGMDIGSPLLLEKFYRQRRIDNELMIYFTHGINSLFLSKFRPVKYIRRLGLSLVDKMEPLKKFFMKKAMGIKTL